MSSILRIIFYGIQGFRRNIWLSIIAVITMLMTLLTLTSFALGDLIAKQRYEEFNRKNIDYVVFVKDTASEPDIELFRDQIDNRPEVLQVEYFDKEAVRKRFDELFSNEPDLKGIITDDSNPLPREITVKFHNPEDINTFDSFVTEDKYKEIVERTSYQNNKQVIDNYVRITNFIKVAGLSFTAFFIIIAVLVILNTIRLTIYSRREEIEIMRYVGATQGFIRGPFIVEGILFGLISALLAALIAWIAISQLQALVSESFALGSTNVIAELFGSTLGVGSQNNAGTVFTYLFILQLVAGMALGVICSILAVRRYLKE